MRLIAFLFGLIGDGLASLKPYRMQISKWCFILSVRGVIFFYSFYIDTYIHESWATVNLLTFFNPTRL